MQSYEETKSRLLDIADVLKKFPENVQPRVYELLIRNDFPKPIADVAQSMAHVKKTKVKENGHAPRPRISSRIKENYKLITDLDLREGTDKPSFKTFVTEKQPSSAIQFNTVAVYYLTEILGLDSVSHNHIYTCYSEVKHRIPNVLSQSLRDTTRKQYGYINIAEDGVLSISLRGKNFVEHDLPKKPKK
jgi:hypothetical protein